MSTLAQDKAFIEAKAEEMAGYVKARTVTLYGAEEYLRGASLALAYDPADRRELLDAALKKLHEAL